jgi:lysyl endopeptidase
MFRYTLPTSAALGLMAVLFHQQAQGQISHGGIPYSITRVDELPEPFTLHMPPVDLAPLEAQDAVNDLDKSIPYRFGFNHAVNLGIDNSGSWYQLEGGMRVWRLGIQCNGALSVNFEFHQFDIPEGAQVFVLNDAGEHIGAFTRANDNGDHVLGVQAMRGERIIVEYAVPAGLPLGALRIGQVTHGYRDIFAMARGLGDSGSCNNNVICPQYDPWRPQIRSVAIITLNGNGLCTGQLINNCAQNGTPYFLTARHCLPQNNNVSTWVFRFNWESPSCTLNQNGPTNQTISGATLLAQNSGSDMALLQLSSTPPASYNVYYSGWDNSGVFPSSQVAIHHPSGDVKKISFDNQAAGQASYGSALCWRIFNWESGTTEPGSSGSGLWDQNGRLIGQLYGGQATCSNNVNDYYGRFDVSYPIIQQWLGACGSTLNGYDPNSPSLALDAQVQQVSGLAVSTCNSSISPVVTVRNAGLTTLTSFTLTWNITNGPSGNQAWSGTLTSGSTVNVALGSINLPVGSNTFTVTVGAPNGGVDQNTGNNQSSGQVVYGNNTVTFNLTLDRYGNETTWQIVQGATVMASGGPYSQFASNGQYPQPPVSICLPDGCYQLIVSDSYGDGLCCAYGTGGFSLTSSGGTVLASGGTFTYTSTHPFCVQQNVQLAARVRLEGPYVSATLLMNDNLRSSGYLPLVEPYSAMGFTQVGSGGESMQVSVLSVTGTNAIVDWVLVELRTGSPGYTVVATRNALLQRDGDIVATDGTSPVSFSVAPGNYHIAVRHRNHLGIMSANAIALSGTPTSIDLSSGAVATYGTEARRNINGVQVMWAGNTVQDGLLKYTGSSNDRDPILVRIGGTVPTNIANGYFPEDLDMNGTVRYAGTTNDRDILLQNIGGTVPTNTRSEQLP